MQLVDQGEIDAVTDKYEEDIQTLAATLERSQPNMKAIDEYVARR